MSDENEKASALDTLSFALLRRSHLVGRLAHLFLRDKARAEEATNRKRAINDRSVGEWLEGVYTAVRGERTRLIRAIVIEAKRQQVIRAQREKNTAYQYKAPSTKDIRRNRVARHLYRLYYKGLSDEEHQPLPPRCRFIVIKGEHVIAADEGDHRRPTYIYIRHNKTGSAMLIDLGRGERELTSLLTLCYSLAPKDVRSVMFFGVPVTIDWDRLAFVVGGGDERRIVPWEIEGQPITTDGFKKIVHRLN